MTGPIQRGLFGEDRLLREQGPQKAEQLPMFDAHIDRGRFAGPAEQVALGLLQEDPRTEEQAEADRMRAAAALTGTFIETGM